MGTTRRNEVAVHGRGAGPRRAAAAVAAAVMVAGCTGPLSGGRAGDHPCSRATLHADEDAAPGTSALVAAADRVRDQVHAIPGVAGSWADEATGHMVYDVASGEDGGASTCAALTDVLDDADVPYRFEVFEGPVESTVRTTVGFGEAWTDDGVGLHVNAWSCNGEPEITALEETPGEVRLEITATVPAPGWGGDACLDPVTVPLELPIGERTLTDLTTGEDVAVELRRYG